MFTVVRFYEGHNGLIFSASTFRMMSRGGHTGPTGMY